MPVSSQISMSEGFHRSSKPRDSRLYLSATDIALLNGVSVLAVKGWIEWANVRPFTSIDGTEMFTKTAVSTIEAQRSDFEAAGRMQGCLYPRAPRFWGLTPRPRPAQVRGVSIE